MEETATVATQHKSKALKCIQYRPQPLDSLLAKMPWITYSATFHIILTMLTTPPEPQFPNHEVGKNNGADTYIILNMLTISPKPQFPKHEIGKNNGTEFNDLFQIKCLVWFLAHSKCLINVCY